MNSAQVENGKVVNIIVGVLDGFVECDNTVQIGDDYDGTNFSRPPEPVIPPTETDYENSIQAHLDNQARTDGYDGILSACSYAGHTNPFQAEGQAYVTWRGNVWAYAYAELDKVKAGTRTQPTIEEFIAEMPTYVAP